MKSELMIELNYFDCRGRVQALRNYFHERDIPFLDNRVSIDDGFQEWSSKAKDRGYSGELGLLPALRKHGITLTETLVIAFELEPHMSMEERMLISSTYNDVIETIGMLIWADVAFPGTDLKAATAITSERIRQRFCRYEDSPLLDLDDKASLAQHFLGESIDSARYVFGALVEEWMLHFPKLCLFDKKYQTISCRFTKPAQFTSRPNEIQTVMTLRR